jgi:hypothetical protein
MGQLFFDGPRPKERIPFNYPNMYSFLNLSPKNGAHQLRGFWEYWFCQFPETSEKADLTTRFSSNNERTHQGAALELLTFAILTTQGFTLTPHPLGHKSTSPDFLVTKNGDELFYVECLAVGNPPDQQRQQKQRHAIENLLHGLKANQYMLGVSYLSENTKAPSLKRLRAEVQSWLTQLESLHSPVLTEQMKWEGGG